MSEYARLIEIFERLVAYKTVSGDRRAASECLEYVEQALMVAGLKTDTYSSNGFESLVATTRNTKHPKLLLQAHLDVVPADNEMFSLKRTGKKLVGRGTFDMKYAAACFLMLAEEWQDRLPEYDLGFMFTTDEETSGADGVKYLLEQGYGCDVCLLPDGGDNWRLETVAKGGWEVQATAYGKTAHGSRPWEGENAIDKLVGFLNQLRSLMPENVPTGNSISVNQLSGGLIHNQVPDEACACLDIRYLNETAGAEIRAQVEQLAEKQNIKLSTLVDIKSVELDLTLPVVAEWERIVTSVRGEKGDGYALSFGASDARFFAEKGIPCLVTRPDGGGHHGENEWIDEAGLYDFYECAKKFVEAWARPDLASNNKKRYTKDKLPETVAESPLS